MAWHLWDDPWALALLLGPMVLLGLGGGILARESVVLRRAVPRSAPLMRTTREAQGYLWAMLYVCRLGELFGGAFC